MFLLECEKKKPSSSLFKVYNYALVTELDEKPDKVQVAVVLTIIGEEMRDS